MKEFRNYKPVTESNSTARNDTDMSQQLQDNITKYSNMDQEQLMEQLVQSVVTQKSNGTYDKDKVSQFVTMASSILSPDQSQRMKQLLDKLD